MSDKSDCTKDKIGEDFNMLSVLAQANEPLLLKAEARERLRNIAGKLVYMMSRIEVLEKIWRSLESELQDCKDKLPRKRAGRKGKA